MTKHGNKKEPRGRGVGVRAGFLKEEIYQLRPEEEQHLARKESEGRMFRSEGKQVQRPWHGQRYGTEGMWVWEREEGVGRRLAGIYHHRELGLCTQRLTSTSSLTHDNTPTRWVPSLFLLYLRGS